VQLSHRPRWCVQPLISYCHRPAPHRREQKSSHDITPEGPHGSFVIDRHGDSAALLVGTAVSCLATAVFATTAADAYGTPITLEQARAAIADAEAEGKKNGWNQVFAVVDGGGNLIAFEKTDFTGNANVRIALAKAKMAASYRVPTKLYQDRLAAGETFILALPGAIPAAGGVPIVVGGKLIGAIGVSGATSLQDHQSAEAGAAAVK